MTIYYRPLCHAENRLSDANCHRCGAELDTGGADYVSKLISALDHPEPETPVRAAWILGELRERRTVEALERVGGEVAEWALGLAAADPNRSVREAAERVLQWLSAGHGANT